MTPEEMGTLGDRLGWYAWRLGEIAAGLEKQAAQTTWTGGARKRFDRELDAQLDAARRLDSTVGECARELKDAAGRLRDVLDALRADEREVRAAYPAHLKAKGYDATIIGMAELRLPPPLDPRWADLAREVLGRSQTRGALS